MSTEQDHYITISFHFLAHDGDIAALSLSQAALHHCRLCSDRSKQVWQSKSLSSCARVPRRPPTPEWVLSPQHSVIYLFFFGFLSKGEFMKGSCRFLSRWPSLQSWAPAGCAIVHDFIDKGFWKRKERSGGKQIPWAASGNPRPLRLIAKTRRSFPAHQCWFFGALFWCWSFLLRVKEGIKIKSISDSCATLQKKIKSFERKSKSGQRAECGR